MHFSFSFAVIEELRQPIAPLLEPLAEISRLVAEHRFGVGAAPQ
jgi:hypothetical protein